MNNLSDRLIVRLSKLTDEQLNIISEAIDKVTLEDAAKFLNLERHIMTENCYNCDHRHYCSLFDLYIQKSFDSDVLLTFNDVCPRWSGEKYKVPVILTKKEGFSYDDNNL